MDFAIWSDKLSVDIDLIDDQHKILIQLINDTSRLIVEKNDSKVQEVLNELRLYTDTHFTEEEELFKKSDYPYIDKHLEEHRYFINKLSDFDNNLQLSDASVSLNILEFLKNWLFYHIEIVDKGYALYVKKVIRGY
jgi:hemerythrin-like metal-binding protein